MSYRTIVVGTDGSESSLRAVDRAAAIAAQEKAKLVIASAHLDTSEKGGWSRPPSPDRLIDGRAADSLGGASYRMHGSASVYAILQDARERAKAAGAHAPGGPCKTTGGGRPAKGATRPSSRPRRECRRGSSCRCSRCGSGPRRWPSRPPAGPGCSSPP